MAQEEVNSNKVRMLRQIAEYYHITRNVDFAKFFGISGPTAFARLKSGSIDFEEIYNKCPDISAEWLLNGGEGPMLKSERIAKIVASQNTNIGTGANQYISMIESEALKNATAALAREQEALAKSQEHISGLIDALSKK